MTSSSHPLSSLGWLNIGHSDQSTSRITLSGTTPARYDFTNSDFDLVLTCSDGISGEASQTFSIRVHEIYIPERTVITIGGLIVALILTIVIVLVTVFIVHKSNKVKDVEGIVPQGSATYEEVSRPDESSDELSENEEYFVDGVVDYVETVHKMQG